MNKRQNTIIQLLEKYSNKKVLLKEYTSESNDFIFETTLNNRKNYQVSINNIPQYLQKNHPEFEAIQNVIDKEYNEFELEFYIKWKLNFWLNKSGIEGTFISMLESQLKFTLEIYGDEMGGIETEEENLFKPRRIEDRAKKLNGRKIYDRDTDFPFTVNTTSFELLKPSININDSLYIESVTIDLASEKIDLEFYDENY